jgi:hypothetical protein
MGYKKCTAESNKKTGSLHAGLLHLFISSKWFFPVQAKIKYPEIVVQDPAKKARISDVHLLFYIYYVAIDQQLNSLFFDGPLTRSIPPENLFNYFLPANEGRKTILH